MIHKAGTETVQIVLKDVILHGHWYCPDRAMGLVIFSHGSGSSRWSPRNNYVAEQFHEKGLGTFLFDLLTEREDQDYEKRFDIGLLSRRLIDTTLWIGRQEDLANLPLGYFGASTGAASAVRAAAHFGETIRALVSRGGRPDLAMEELPAVTAPTLFIVGGRDHSVIRLNRQAYSKLTCRKRLEIIPHASHLFEEPGKLQEVAELSAQWFRKWMRP